MTTNALMKISQEVISSNEQLHNFVQRVKEITNPLFPDTLNFVRPEFKLSATVVSVDANVDKYGNNRDIYKTENGQYALHLSKLNEIAKAAGLQITDSKILERKIDSEGRVTYILFQVKGYVKGIDGSIKEDVATGKYDYYRDLEKYTSPKQVKGRRGHAEALAESNAKTRLFNKLVTKLPQSFTLKELQKPFLVPCVIEDKYELLKDLDPETQKQIKAEYAREQLGLSRRIYPAAGRAALPEASQTPADAAEEITEANVVEEEHVAAPQTEPQQTKISFEEQMHILAEEFRHAPQKERTEKIMQLIETTKYSDPNGIPFTKARIEQNSLDTQIKFLEKLLTVHNQAEAELI